MRIALFSLIEWDFVNQRPHAFARELAALGHQILYVEPPPTVDNIDAWAEKVQQGDINTYKIEDNISICEGMLMPLRDPRQYQFNQALHSTIAQFLKAQGIEFSIVLSPEYVDALLLLGRPFTYDHLDETQFMDGIDTEAYIDCMSRLKDASIFNIYIQEPAALADPKGLFVPNGADADVFFPIDKPRLFDAVILSTFAKWFDMDSVLASTSRILLIGPMDNDIGNNKERFFEANKPNLLWIPQVDKRTANAWLSTAEVGLVPFKLTHPVVPYAMPVKIMEYMLAGLKVVSYRSDAIEYFYRDRICYYGETTGHHSLDEAIAAAKRLSTQREFALQFSWKHVVAQLNGKIMTAVAKQMHDPAIMPDLPAIPALASLAPYGDTNGTTDAASFKRQISRLQDQLRHRTQRAASLFLECERHLNWARELEKWALELQPQAQARVDAELKLQRLEAIIQLLLSVRKNWWLALGPTALKQAFNEALAFTAAANGEHDASSADAVPIQPT